MTTLDPLALPLSGTTLIEASAGTGKTYTLATLYLRLLLEQRLEIGQILVVTYTNAATAELRDRIRRRLREALALFAHAEREGAPPARVGEGRAPLVALVEASRRAGTLARDRRHLAAALRGFDEAAIFTIHGFCQRILLENAFESGVAFDAELVTEDGPLCTEVVQDFWLRALHDAPAALVRHAYAKGLVPDDLERLARRVLTHRDMAILPETAATPDVRELERLIAEHHAAREVAAAIWRTSRAEIERLLGTAPLNQSVYRSDRLAVACGELHAWLERAFGALPELSDEVKKFSLGYLATKTRGGAPPPRHDFFTACDRLRAAQEALQRCYREFEVGLQRDLVDFVRTEVDARHDLAGTQSFDDLLYRLRDALRAPTGELLASRVRERFRAALIDEFQDTDPVQYEIFRTVYAQTERPLFLIGDPKQAIYGFRGADVFTYVAAKAGASAHTLDTNHRSARRLVEAVNALFRRARDPFVFPDIPFHAVRPADGPATALGGPLAGAAPLELLFVRDSRGKGQRKDPYERHVPGAIANEVVRLLASGTTIGGRPLHAGDVAILCRANRQAVRMQEELRRRGVPSVLQGDDSVFESAEAEEIERALRAIAEPAEPKLVRAALATRVVGLDAHALVALQGDEAEWDRWAARFRDWLALWTEHGFMAAFRHLLDACGTQRRLLALADGERRLTNVLHVAELLQTAAREAHRGPLALVDWLTLMRNDAKARVEMAKEAAQIRLESDERAVQLVTIHRSKGLEYGVVFCPFTWDGMDLHPDERKRVKYHDPSDGLALKLDLHPEGKDDPHLQRARLEDFAENLRLLYVAVTRAKHRCTLVWASAKSAQHAPLGYLLHQAADDGAGDRVAATKERIKQLDDAAMLDDLLRLAAESDGAIGVREISIPGAASPLLHSTAEDDQATVLAPLVAARALDAAWRTSSFSRLAASGGRTSHQAEEGIDRDETGPARAEDAAVPRARERGPAPVVLHELRAGARTGELLHWILEHVDFARPDRDELPARVRDGLARFAGEATWEPALVRGLEEVLATPLGGDAGVATLGAIARARRLVELPFLLPVRRTLDRSRLAACFERHPSAVRPADYPARIRRLGFGALEGFLSGFIDLVFEHGGRWYVVDYKSNFLGPRPEDYRPSLLERAMSLHHYYLQYHLYALAVHRHLATRLPGYAFEEHFGGVYYLFLRGMSPRHEPSCGVFHDRPSAALIDDLSALLGPPAAGGGA